MKIIALLAGLILTGCPVSYIHHPKAVARTLERRLERTYPGATVTVQCTQQSRLVDYCQANVFPAPGVTYWFGITVTIAPDGRSFRITQLS